MTRSHVAKGFPQRRVHAGVVHAVQTLHPRFTFPMNFDDRRFVLVAAVIFVCVVFILRLFYIQVADDSWKARAADISERKITVFRHEVSSTTAAVNCWWPTHPCTTSWWCHAR